MNSEDFEGLRRWLATLEPSLRCAFADDAEELQGCVEQLAERAASPFSVVCIRGEPGSGISAHLERAVQVLADAVLIRCPVLGRSAAAQMVEDVRETHARTGGLGQSPRRVPAAFWRRVVEACDRGEPPRSREHSLAAEAEYLASCLDPERLLLLWVLGDTSLEDEQGTDEELLGVSRAAEWLGANTHASVLVVVPERFRDRAALDAISYAALRCRSEGAANGAHYISKAGSAGGASSPTRPIEVRSAPSAEAATPRRSRPRVTALWPVIGQPHPLSPAEQALARALATDAELSARFAWNQVVLTREQTRPIVDLLWRTGRLVVEIDGFAHHASRRAFEQDRQRDWELLVSGYRVLRLAASEVLADPARSLEKLRALTRNIEGERR